MIRNKPFSFTKPNGARLAAWSVMLLVSLLPDIVLNEWLGLSISWLFWGKLAVLATSLGLSFVWNPLRRVRLFLVALLALQALEYGRALLMETGRWQLWFGGGSPSFTQFMLGNQLLRVSVALAMIGVLLILGFRPAAAYLKPGRLDAPVQPIRFLGIKAGEIRWSRFGWMSALAIGSGTLLFLLMGGGVPAGFFSHLLPVFPAILLFATMNAFAEEVSYRAALLAPLRGVLGERDAILLTAVFFGVAHFYGVPYGPLGVVMATILGWLLGKSMVETEGFFWPWFIHFVQDVLIFSFMAVGSVVPGG
jgi:hypothetical protein